MNKKEWDRLYDLIETVYAVELIEYHNKNYLRSPNLVSKDKQNDLREALGIAKRMKNND